MEDLSLKITIQLQTQMDVIQFANIIAQKCRSRVAAERGTWRVNANSILGLLSLDTSKGVSITFSNYVDYYNCEKDIEKWRVD